MKTYIQFTKRILLWYEKNAMRFPWRETKDPYKILIAEILLRKTDRNQVKPVFEKLMRIYSDPAKLATADVRKLREIIRPLGLYRRRTSLLIGLAREVIKKHGGKVPKEKSNLMKIPGVGPYSASAVLCLAYNKRVPMIDTNVARIIGRIFQSKFKVPPSPTDEELQAFVKKLIPKRKVRDFNLALLDFANLICTSKTLPKCPICPVNDMCDYFKKKALSCLSR